MDHEHIREANAMNGATIPEEVQTVPSMKTLFEEAKKTQNNSMHVIGSINDDLDTDSQSSIKIAQKCENCENYRVKLLNSKKENAELKAEMQRMTDRLDNIRKL